MRAGQRNGIVLAHGGHAEHQAAGGNLIAYHITEAVDDRKHDHIEQRDGNLVDQAAEGEHRALQPLAALHLQIVDQVREHGNQKHHRHPNREIGEEAQHNIGDKARRCIVRDDVHADDEGQDIGYRAEQGHPDPQRFFAHLLEQRRDDRHRQHIGNAAADLKQRSEQALVGEVDINLHMDELIDQVIQEVHDLIHRQHADAVPFCEIRQENSAKIRDCGEEGHHNEDYHLLIAEHNLEAFNIIGFFRLNIDLFLDAEIGGGDKNTRHHGEDQSRHKVACFFLLNGLIAPQARNGKEENGRQDRADRADDIAHGDCLNTLFTLWEHQRRQALIGDIQSRIGRVIKQVGDDRIGKIALLPKVYGEEQHGGRQHDRDYCPEDIGAAFAALGAGTIDDQAHHRIVDRIPYLCGGKHHAGHGKR